MTHSTMQFRGEYKFLSNFQRCNIRMSGCDYPSAENAFQAAKTLDPALRKAFQECSPVEARKMGRGLALREDWEDIKLDLMLRILRMKFKFGSVLGDMLMNTGDVYLSEGNYWNDTYWGFSLQKNVGQNVMGKLLMQVRAELMVRSSGLENPQPAEEPLKEMERAHCGDTPPWI